LVGGIKQRYNDYNVDFPLLPVKKENLENKVNKESASNCLPYLWARNKIDQIQLEDFLYQCLHDDLKKPTKCE